LSRRERLTTLVLEPTYPARGAFVSKTSTLLGLLLIVVGNAELLAQSPRSPPRNTVKAAFDVTNPAFPSLGRADAPIAIVEFSEFGCPYCRRHANDVLPRLLEKYVNAGEVRYFFAQVPVDGERSSEIGAKALLCAAQANATLPMYQLLFQSGEIDRLKVDAGAASLGLEAAAFARCEDSADTHAQLLTHVNLARQSNVIGTPTFFIARIRNGHLVDIKATFGIKTVDYFESVVDRFLEDRP
jgi:protein-disulfide isomerase